MLPEALRGEVWDVDFLDLGLHPAVIVSENPLNTRLGHVAGIVVTGTAGPSETHVPLDIDAGLTKYPVSYADVTSIRSLPRVDLLARRGRVHRVELSSIDDRLRVYLRL